MARLDQLKEEIGWLKVAFGLLMATNLSLMAWLIQHYQTQSSLITALNAIAIVVVTVIIYLINKQAYKKIDEIGEL